MGKSGRILGKIKSERFVRQRRTLGWGKKVLHVVKI